MLLMWLQIFCMHVSLTTSFLPPCSYLVPWYVLGAPQSYTGAATDVSGRGASRLFARFIFKKPCMYGRRRTPLGFLLMKYTLSLQAWPFKRPSDTQQ